MARKRMISPDLWEDPSFGDLSIPSRLLFIGLISHADDEGRGDADPRRLKRCVFGYDDSIGEAEVLWMLGEIADKMRGVVVYEVDGRKYYALTNWRNYQTINKPTPSKLPEDYGSATVVLPHHYGSATVVFSNIVSQEESKGEDGTTVVLREDYGSTTVVLPSKGIEEKGKEGKSARASTRTLETIQAENGHELTISRKEPEVSEAWTLFSEAWRAATGFGPSTPTHETLNNVESLVAQLWASERDKSKALARLTDGIQRYNNGQEPQWRNVAAFLRKAEGYLAKPTAPRDPWVLPREGKP